MSLHRFSIFATKEQPYGPFSDALSTPDIVNAESKKSSEAAVAILEEHKLEKHKTEEQNLTFT